MPKALEQVTEDAPELPPSQRLALVKVLLGSTEAADDPAAEAAWEDEIRERIRAVDGGHISGLAYDEVVQAAEKLLSR